MPSSDHEKRIALVTGANRGIGFEISRQLAERGLFVLLGSRSKEKGEQAARSIRTQKRYDILPVELDITNSDSIRNLSKMVREKFGMLDVLVNNAGVLLDETDYPSKTDLEIARRTFETNLFGTWSMCEAFIPLMEERKYGRIVNVSSGAGQLSSLAEDLYSPAYSLSKASVNALTIILARELKGTNILVNSMDPGWVKTDMGGSNAPRSIEEGADTAVWLATLPKSGPSGGFFQDRTRVDW